jgi:ABC-type transport system involved in multi-copper enzyme maturation permease subunit
MKQATTFSNSIGYPLTALITTNTRAFLFTSKVIAPLIIAALPVLLVAVMRIVFWIFSQWEDMHIGDRFEIYSVISATIFLQFIVPLLALLRGLTIFSEEKRERTITYLFLRPIPRTVLALGKFLGAIIPMMILLALSMAGVFMILGTFPDTDIIQYDTPVLIKDIWILCLGLAAYAGVMMLIGTYFKRSLLIGIFLIFVWDAFASYIPGFAHRLTVKYYIQSIFPHQETRNMVSKILVTHSQISVAAAYITLIGIIAVCIALTTYILKHREFIGEGADAD